MRLPHRILATAALCLFATPAAFAAEVGKVEILGLDEEMTGNVRASLSLVDAIGKQVSGRRMVYLVPKEHRDKHFFASLDFQDGQGVFRKVRNR